MSDAPQQLTIEAFGEVMEDIRPFVQASGKQMGCDLAACAAVT